MGSAALEILGLVLCLVGWVGLILACGLPMWQVTAFLDHNIVTAQTTWKGLWMSCVVQSTGHMQCKVYESVLALSAEVQAARALTVGAVLLALVALFVTLTGAQCTTCVAPGPVKARVALTGGALFALCGLLALVPLCWFANIVVREFYDPAVPVSQKYELGAALYIGWAASALLMDKASEQPLYGKLKAMVGGVQEGDTTPIWQAESSSSSNWWAAAVAAHRNKVALDPKKTQSACKY
ncbi:Claudin-5 [Cricetulus griseus]|uniref:Claudin n=1 Tax=Cricetulus griseus TaxID=10029 RepID=G3HEN6_CRIGR|nr:Claudin-5 [Cricetulus griseus]